MSSSHNYWKPLVEKTVQPGRYGFDSGGLATLKVATSVGRSTILRTYVLEEATYHKLVAPPIQ